MAIEPNKLFTVSAGAAQLHIYQGADALATIIASGYFNSLTNRLKKNDVILCVGTANGAQTIDVLVVAGPSSPIAALVDVPTIDVAVPVEHAAEPAVGATQRAMSVALDAAAYVIFTSGSTGAPRGVEVSHRNLAASNTARSIEYDRTPDRFLVTSSIGFDSSIVGLVWPLTTGGTVVLPDDDEVHDVDRLGAVIERERVTHVLMVPSLYRALLERSHDHLVDLEAVIVAGEPCPQSLVDLHERRLPGVALVNEYGPTEATVWATAHRLRSDEGIVPIRLGFAAGASRCAQLRATSSSASMAGVSSMPLEVRP